MSKENKRLTYLQAIHKKCIDCMGGNIRAIKHCGETLCSLYPYRTGHDPYRKRPTGKKRDTKTGRFQKTEKVIKSNEAIIEGKFKLTRINE